MYHEKLLADKLRLEQEISVAKRELSQLPNMKLICSKNGNATQGKDR